MRLSYLEPPPDLIAAPTTHHAVSVSDVGIAAHGALATYTWQRRPELNAISDAGRWVMFGSDAFNLDPDDSNANWDVFFRNRHLKTTKRLRSHEREDAAAYPIALASSAIGRAPGFKRRVKRASRVG